MKAVVALIRKDLKLFFSDRRSLLVSVLTPIALAAFMGYLTGGSGESSTGRISAITADQDGSATSRDIVARLGGDKMLDVKPGDPESARTAVRKGKTTLAFIIPPNFGADAASAFFSSEKKPEITILFDPSHAAEAGMAEGILTGAVMQAVSKEVFAGQTGRDAVKKSLKNVQDSATLSPEEKNGLSSILQSVDKWNVLAEARGTGSAQLNRGLSVPFQTRSEAVTSRQGVVYNGYAHSFGGMGIQFILFVGIDVGVNLLNQRHRGVWARLRAAPLSRTALLGSRAASTALTSFIVLLIIFGFAGIVFGVRVQGSMAGFIAVCAAFSLMTSAFGLLVAALGKTPEATRGLSILITLLMVMLGGAWFPSFLFPAWLQQVTLFAPTRWAMDGLDAMTWRGLGLSAAIGPVLVMLGCAAAFGALAVARFSWESER
jgi:ABC-2 type transport system permease protein